MRRAWGIGTVLIAALLTAAPASAAEVTVATGNGANTLRDAVDNATTGEIITFAPGIQPIVSGGEIVITDAITIRGNGVTGTTISAQGNSRVFRVVPGVTATFEDLTIDDGKAADGAMNANGGDGFDGGAIHSAATSLTLRGVQITNSQAGHGGPGTTGNGGDGGGGGAIFSTGGLHIFNSTFRGNSAGSGGPGDDGAGGDVSGNGGHGGAIQIGSPGTLNVAGTTFTDNDAGQGGQGDFDFADGRGLPGGGGAIHSSGSTFVSENSTFTENHSGSVVTGTASFSHGEGGAIWEDSSASATINGSTFAGNSGIGAVARDGVAVPAISGSLFSANTVPPSFIAVPPMSRHCGIDPVTDGGGNLMFPAEQGLGCPAGFAVGDPLLGPLKDNGGPTETMAIAAGSAALDRASGGACGGLTTDQRGVARPLGPACDSGAFEAPFTPAAGGQASLPAPNPQVAKKCKKKKAKKASSAKKKKKCKKKKRK